MGERASRQASEGLGSARVNRVCAWCSDSPDSHERASHGICRSCLSSLLVPVRRPRIVSNVLVARSAFA